MKALANKVNTVPAGGDYPYGDLKDNPGDNSGTPVNRDLMGDIHRTVEKIMDEGNVTPNNLDDNETNGYQVYEAMVKAIRGYEVTSFIFDQSNTGNEVTILKDELGLDFQSYSKTGNGVYSLIFNDVSNVDANTIYNNTNVYGAGGLGTFIFMGIGVGSNPLELLITNLTSGSGIPVDIAGATVIEIRKYI